LRHEKLSFGTVGPSLYRFGKLRGFGEETQKYAYGKIYNSQAFLACSNMPALRHNGRADRGADHAPGRAAPRPGFSGQQMI